MYFACEKCGMNYSLISKSVAHSIELQASRARKPCTVSVHNPVTGCLRADNPQFLALDKYNLLAAIVSTGLAPNIHTETLQVMAYEPLQRLNTQPCQRPAHYPAKVP